MSFIIIISSIIVLHSANLTGLAACLFPTGKIPVHQGVETGVVAWLQQMAQLVNDDMLHTPYGEQQQIG